MPKESVDVVGVGNAIVDVIAQVSDEFIAEEGLEKGSMTLIDDERADKLYKLMGTGQEASGGSAANTMAGIALLRWLPRPTSARSATMASGISLEPTCERSVSILISLAVEGPGDGPIV